MQSFENGRRAVSDMIETALPGIRSAEEIRKLEDRVRALLDTKVGPETGTLSPSLIMGGDVLQDIAPADIGQHPATMLIKSRLLTIVNARIMDRQEADRLPSSRPGGHETKGVEWKGTPKQAATSRARAESF